MTTSMDSVDAEFAIAERRCAIQAIMREKSRSQLESRASMTSKRMPPADQTRTLYPEYGQRHPPSIIIWTTKYGMDQERLTMDDEEWQSFKLPPFSHQSKAINTWRSLQLPISFRSNQRETRQETHWVEVAETLAFPPLKLNTAKLKALGSAIEIHHISA
mmetsp:Transcript_2839/g.4146  ORF Transcript_2839/g.4146 Transcript_2839/m.4146 type:complete len:160 (+) Transcript_2839:321-800(+)